VQCNVTTRMVRVTRQRMCLVPVHRITQSNSGHICAHYAYAVFFTCSRGALHGAYTIILHGLVSSECSGHWAHVTILYHSSLIRL